MIPLAVPNLHGNESRYLQECIDSNSLSSEGPFVKRFENRIALTAGARACVTTSSCTTALQMALLAVGVKSGDLVIVPSFTFIGSANAISHCGAIPWLFDIEPFAWTLDPEQLREELKIQIILNNGQPVHRASGRRIGAMMPVHLIGNPADMESLAEIGRTYDIPIVADGAAALGATYQGGGLTYRQTLTTFSFGGGNTVTCGAGGAVVADDTSKIEFIRHISSSAATMTNLQAAVGSAQIEQLETFVQRKREIDAFYRATFSGNKTLSTFPRPTWGESSCWLSGIVLNSSAPLSIDDLGARLAGASIECKPFWQPLHLQPAYSSAPKADLALTSEIWSRVLALPCSTGITDAELAQVAAAVLGNRAAKTA